MTFIDLEGLMPNIILEDLRLNMKNTYITQLTVLTVKSLLPLEKEVGNEIDYMRFKEELKLWMEYCIEGEASPLSTFKGFDGNSYLNYYDETYYTRLIPIIVSNTDLGIIEKQLIKNILFFSGSINNLLEWLMIGVLIYLSTQKNQDLIDGLKEYIINFSQRDLLERHGQDFRLDIDRLPNSIRVSFERERINILNVLNGVKSDMYKNLQDCLGILNKGMPTTSIGRIIYGATQETDIETLDVFYVNLNKYVSKLRKGRIPLEDLKINDYVLPDIFGFEEGDMFYHSLLNHSKVIKKEVRADGLTSLISTKSGNYLFKRNLR
jgi:hypothetical protein